MAVVATILAIYIAVLMVFSGVQSQQDRQRDEQPPLVLWNPQLFLGVALGTIVVILGGSGYKTMALSAGGSAVSEMMGARPVSASTTDPDERKLLNVVEEMAIASGVPVPAVYVMDNEERHQCLRRRPQTRRCDRDRHARLHETSDARRIARRHRHEFSHILNGDMRLNLRLMGIIFGILCLAIIGRILLQTSRGGGRSRGQNPLPLLGIVFAHRRLHRRFLWTTHPGRRQPPARISRRRFVRPIHQKSRRHHRRAKENRWAGRNGFAPFARPCRRIVAYVFFATASARRSSGCWKRIRLCPNASAPSSRPLTAISPSSATTIQRKRRRSLPKMRSVRRPCRTFWAACWAAQSSLPATMKATRHQDTFRHAQPRQPTPLHLEYAVKMRDALPESIKAAAREPLDAVALNYALLLSPDGTTRATQLAGLASRIESATYQKTIALYPEVSSTAVPRACPSSTSHWAHCGICTRTIFRLSPRRSNGSSKAMKNRTV